MNKYKHYTDTQRAELFSNYLVNSWSYSAVQTFARNEKAFEMIYIYQEKDKRSVSSIAGNAYHEALKYFFENFEEVKNSSTLSVDLLQIAYDYLDTIAPKEWKLTDKFNSVEVASQEANKIVTSLIANLLEEIEIYTDNIESVLSVEERIEDWVTINNEDIPLPLHAVMDTVVRLKNGKYVIIDHKSKSKFTNEEDIALTHGQQAITYVAIWEAKNEDKPISEVWFIENKVSKNKDKSPQLRKHIISIDNESRKLYEALLYSPLKRLLNAVSDPDYEYLINPNDTFTDKAVLFDFWARQVSNSVNFEAVPEDKKARLEDRQKKISNEALANIKPEIVTKFKQEARNFIVNDYTHSGMTPSEKIEHLFRTFNKKVQVQTCIEGFSCDTYLCKVAIEQKIVDLFKHQLDLANALDVPNVRIPGYLTMYENSSYLAIEVNKKRSEVLLWDKSFLEGHKIPIGQDNFRNPIIWDLDNHATPHALICGSTGSGKSVELNSIIEYAKLTDIEDIIIFDPKYEFIQKAGGKITVYNEIEDIERVMSSLVDDMNIRIKTGRSKLTLVIFDEFADANDLARSSKQLEIGEKTLQENYKMLLQKGRSCGFRFVAATQRADTKTINGTIKVNFPVLICFRVPKAVDSKVVLDEEGAQTLMGYGDGLIRSPQYMDRTIRFQGFYKPNQI